MTPVDPKRCQAFSKQGSFMTLGPRNWERCELSPAVILSEIKPGLDGKKGSMSLCEDCLLVFKKLNPDWKKCVTITKLKQ